MTVFECQDLNLMKFWPMHFFPRFDAIKIILALKMFCPRLNADKMSSLNNNVKLIFERGKNHNIYVAKQILM
jgi:hypothetical protein